MSESEHQAAAGRAASELASVLSRRRQEVDTKGAFFTKDRKGHADAVWNERTDSQFSPRSSERKSAIARLQGASVSPYASREASPAPQPPEDGRPKVLRRMSADATMTAPNALLEDRARRSFAPRRASTGPVLKAPIQRLGSARSASPTLAPSTSSASPPRTQRPPKAKSKATPRRSASAATEAALPSSRQPQQSPEPVRTSAAAALRTGSATEPDLSRPSGRVPAEHGAVAENIAKFEVTQAPQSAVGKLCPKVSGELGSSTPSEAEEAVPGGGGSASSHGTKEASKPVAKPATKPASKPKAASKSVCKPKAKVAASVGEDPPQRESAQESPRKAVQLPREAVEKDATSSSLRQDPQLGSKETAKAGPSSPRSPCSESSVATASTISCEAPAPSEQQREVNRAVGAEQPKQCATSSGASEGAGGTDMTPQQRRTLRLSMSGVTGDTELSDLLESDVMGHTTTYDSSRQPSACSNATSTTRGLPTILTTAVGDKPPASDKQSSAEESSAVPSTDNREEDQPDKTDTGQHGQQSDLNVPKPKLGMEQSIQVKKWEALAEPEPAPSPECRSTSGEIPAGGHDSPSFALSPCGMESDVKDECQGPRASVNNTPVASQTGASDAARATPTQKISHTEVVTDPDLWQAVTEGDLRKLQDLVAAGLLRSGRVVDVNRHSIFWNALAFQQIKVAAFLLHHFPPGSAQGVDISEVHPRRQDTLLHLCLYLRDFSACAAEVFQQLYLGIGHAWTKAALQAYRSRPTATQDTFLHCAAARLNFWVLRYALSSADAVYLLQHKNCSNQSALEVLMLKLSEVHRSPSPSLVQAPQEAERPFVDFGKYLPTTDGSQDSREPAFADVELEVEDSGEVCRVPAHRAILGAASSVLHEQLVRCAPGRPLRINPLCCHSKQVLLTALGFLYRSRLHCNFSEDGFLLWQLLCLCTEYDLPKPLWRYAKAALLAAVTQTRYAPVLPVLLEARAQVGLDQEEAAAISYALLCHHEVGLKGMPIEEQSQVILIALGIVEHYVLEPPG